MAFQYRYKAFDFRNRLMYFLKRNSRSVTIVSVLVILTFSFYLITSSVTGYITYTENLEIEFNETQKELDITTASLDECSKNMANIKEGLTSCNSELDQSRSQLTTCENERNELRTKNSELDSQLSTCNAESEDLKARYESRLSAFDNLVRNSVKAICCSFNDIDAGLTKNWGIVDDKIVCTGGYSVNCTSGATDY